MACLCITSQSLTALQASHGILLELGISRAW